MDLALVIAGVVGLMTGVGLRGRLFNGAALVCGAVAGMGLLSGVGIEYSCCDVMNCGGVWMEHSARPNWLSGLAICWSKGGSVGCLAWRPKAIMKRSGWDRVMAGDAGTVYGLAARDLGGASLLVVGRR